jgi:hypothetical protein
MVPKSRVSTARLAVGPFAKLKWIACAGIFKAESLVFKGDHMLAIERLDVGRGGLGPFDYDGGCASIASWLVGQFPSEDSG